MSVLEFLDSSVFTPVYQNDVPLISSPRVEAICRELKFAIQNEEEIFVYGDYDTDGFCSVKVWQEVFSLLQAKPPVVFQYVARTHELDRDIIRQVHNANARVVIICDTGSGINDQATLRILQMNGYTTIVIDHHVFGGSYSAECESRLTFNSYEERACLDNCEVSGAYAALLVAKVLCEKYLAQPLSFNAKVYALCSMYADCVPLDTPVGRALYNAVAVSNAKGPNLFRWLNSWNYLYGRRFFSYIVAPKLNACFRSERLDVLNRLLLVQGRYETQGACEELLEIHAEAKTLVQMMVPQFVRTKYGDLVFCVHEVTPETEALHIRNYTGVIATHIASEEMAATICVVKRGSYYSGSFRDYYGRDLLTTFKLFADCAGHPSAFKVEFGNLNEFLRHLKFLGGQLNQDYAKPYMVLNSSVIEDDADLNALALYNEYKNMGQSVVISHQCSSVRCINATRYNKYYSVGLPTEKVLMTKRTLLDGMSVLIEPSICRGVELREME